MTQELDLNEGYAGDDPEVVACDDNCGARENPTTLDQYRATLEHYKHHPYMLGCSHGNI